MMNDFSFTNNDLFNIVNCMTNELNIMQQPTIQHSNKININIVKFNLQPTDKKS